MTCPVCGAKASVLARPARWTFARCSACGTYFVDPMPEGDAVEEAGSVYTDTYYGGEARADEDLYEQATLQTSDARIRSLERALGRKGRLLDIGCGTGYLLAAAKQRGWDVTGVEVSPRAAEFAKQTHQVDVVVGTLSSAGFPAASFDAVTLVHVLEHVPKPVALLEDVRRVLKPDGLLALAIPNPRALLYTAYNAYHFVRGRYRRTRYSCSLYPPSHLYAWDSAALEKLLARAGFEISELTITGKGDPQRYPMVKWSGRFVIGQRVAETLGRKIGRGSLIEVLARPVGLRS